MTAAPNDLGPLVRLHDPLAASTAVVAPARGAIVTSFAVRGRELLYMDAGTLHDRTKNVRGGIPILFPTPGKLEQDHWRFASRTGSMKQHGFARNLAWTITSQSAAAVSLILESNDETLAQFPWSFHAQLAISVRDAGLRLDARIQNTGREAMPYGLGFHPYFHVRGKANARIASGATRAFDNVKQAVVPFTGFDLTQSEVDLHLLDHPDRGAILQLEDGAQIVVSASSDFVRWVIWTLAERDFVCLEPWTAPGNALNTGEQLIVLPPGATHASHVDIEFHAHG